jgi:phenylpropionate dioxygenase-like ring-hydroxylating dioxygenase large terminal subunit
MSLPTDRWYVIAATDEIGSEPLARQVCGHRVVLYRTESGRIACLADRCSHRGFPLSAGGRVVGDDLQCNYHGLKFDCSGVCTWVPGQDRIPSRANIASYAIEVQGPWVWIWAGDPSGADRSLLPETPWFTADGWAEVHGLEPLAARYGLLIDNLLDLSHETFLHAGYIGTPEVAETPIETTVDDAAGVVHVSRHMEAVECPPFYSESTGLETPIDRWQDIEYHAPGFYLLHVRVAPHGQDPADDEVTGRAAYLKVLYAITPSTPSTTLDFWAVCRNFDVDSPETDAFIAKMNREVVLQDVTALELLELRLAEQEAIDVTPVEVSFKIDSGGLAARRVLASMS